MRIYLLITPFFPTEESFRGPFMYDMVKAIERTRRYDKVVVMRPAPISEKRDHYVFDGIRVNLFPVIQMPSNLLVGLPDAINKRLFLKRVKKLGIDYKDVAVAHTNVSLYALYALAIKEKNPNAVSVIQHHDRDPYALNMSKHLAEQTWNSRINAAHFVRLYNKMDLHLCISTPVKENLSLFPSCSSGEVYDRYKHFLAGMKGLNSPKIKDSYILYNGVDTGIFTPKEKKRDVNVFVIGVIGNYQEFKGHRTVLRAFKRLVDNGEKDIRIKMIGSGEYLEECRQYVSDKDLSDYVEFLTEMPHEKLPDFYRSLDLFVLPSYFEGFGCVFTEAYACGVPFMTCKNQGVSELVEDPDKWLIDKEDDKQLANLIMNYKRERYMQKLNGPYEIDKLIPAYLDKLETL